MGDYRGLAEKFANKEVVILDGAVGTQLDGLGHVVLVDAPAEAAPQQGGVDFDVELVETGDLRGESASSPITSRNSCLKKALLGSRTSPLFHPESWSSYVPTMGRSHIAVRGMPDAPSGCFEHM